MKKRIILIILIVVVAVICVGFAAVMSMGAPLDKKNEQTKLVQIPTGSSTYDIAYTLEDNEIIDNPKAFRVISKLTGSDNKYVAGTYELSPSMSMREIQKIIVKGDSLVNKFTVIPGETVEKIAKKLDESGIVTYDEFMDAEENAEFDYEFIKPHKNKLYRLEGYLLPETYNFDPGTSAEKVIDTMLDRFNTVIYESIYKKSSSEMDFEDVLTVASIIQKEAGNEDDMYKVSSVIYNRLDKDMALQMDSIVSYVLQKDEVNLSNADISIDSAYNPYDNRGLPPGPICSPDVTAVKAAYNPADTDYLYFVLSYKLDGTAVFTKDYDKFLKEKEKYYDAYEKAHKDDQ